MRLLVVGKLSGQLSTAVKMAMSAGAKVSHVESIEAATHGPVHTTRNGEPAELRRRGRPPQGDLEAKPI
jgi:hypothetical protein